MSSPSKPYYVTARERLDQESRVKKAQQIKAILQDYIYLNQSEVLDVGTGAGYIAESLSQDTQSVISVDINDERKITAGYEFLLTSDSKIPTGDAKFDIVISSHVIEHIPNQEEHLEEIYRVLKPGGIVYLATPNKYGPLEPHYKLPLLSWFPRNVSTVYLRLIKSKEWNIYPLSYRKITRLSKNKFYIYNHTLHILKQTQKYHIHVNKLLQRLLNRTPLSVFRLFNPFVPAYIVILTKPTNTDNT